MNENIKLHSILDDIDANRIILPDFQRDYVWVKEEDKIEDFITSVLAQLPIGSIITFRNAFDSFANKEIGFNKKVQYDKDFGRVDFLLDGQQRITTLALVFSDRIFHKCKTNSNYSSNDLVQKDKIKKRYFLKIPKYNSDSFSNDFFGFEKLFFPHGNPDNIEFCSNELKDLIQSETFTFSSNDENRNLWYYPSKTEYTDFKFRRDIRDAAVESGLIPLYLLADHPDIIHNILDSMAARRVDSIKALYPITNYDALKTFINENNELYQIDLEDDPENVFQIFNEVLESYGRTWASNMHQYLICCINNLRINLIAVKDENTSRAINMYEALNKGGAKLTTYDLIIARAASKTNYYAESNKNIISTYFNKELLSVVAPNDSFKTWNSKDYLKTVNRNGEILPIIINQFLNLLCFVSNTANSDFTMNKKPMKDISNVYCKAKKQLDLKADQIVDFTEICMYSLMDALMVLQFKCGIYNISQIDYNLILFPLSYMMYLYESKSIVNVNLNKFVDQFKGLYQYLIFTGEYQSDQSTVVMKHLEWVHNWILCGKTPISFKEENKTKYIDSMVLNITKYNNLDMLLCKEDVLPKKAVRNSLLHYVLSECPKDFIENSKNLTSYDPNIEFEIHHMIPLASGKTLKDTRNLREEVMPLNSPLNLALISKDANRTISDYQISEYLDSLTPEFFADYFMPNEIKTFLYPGKDKGKDEELRNILESRYNVLRSNIIKDIKKNLHI